MRFAYLTCDFGVPVFGPSGASVHVREMVHALREEGHDVLGFTPALGLENGERERDGFHHVPLEGLAGEAVRLLKGEEIGRSHLVSEWRRLVYSEYVQRTLRPALDEFRPDAIYERYSLFAYAGIELAREYDCPLLLEVNAPLTLEASKYRELVLKDTAETLEGRIFRGADALFVVSTDLASHPRRLGVAPERITVLPNAVDPARFDPAVSGEPVRKRFGLDGKRVVGFVGSLKPWHDLDTVRSAMRILVERDPAFHLLVVGGGPRLAELQSSGESFVTCSGAVSHDEVPAALAAMDVVVVPYAKDWEDYFSPLKLFEALAMARPVVGARTGQVAEVVTAGENGFLYEPGDADDLAANILAVTEDPERGRRLAEAARRSIVPERTWQANARRIVERAEACLAERRGRAG